MNFTPCRWLAISILFIGLIFHSPPYFAQNTDSVSSPIEWDKRLELTEKQLSFEIQQLEARIQKEEEKDNSTIWGIIIVAGLSAFGIGFTIYHRALNEVKRLINQDTDKLLDKRKVDFEALLKSASLENKVREEKKILVISPSEEDKRNHLKSFEFLNIKNMRHDIQMAYQEPLEFNPDLIIFNHCSEQLIEEYLARGGERTIYVAYKVTPGLLGVTDDRLGFAKTAFTLFAAILNAFRYAEEDAVRH
ncbi:MAG: hypothetical protein MRZ79_17675 [Bacteroidia bacterium]|nr:hypothetical protein [Bacteroidia bacterium]